MVHSRDKGKRGERELAAELNRLFGVSCRRGQQYNGLDGEDVVGLHPRIHVECKRVESLNIHNAMLQAQGDAKPKSQLPLVCHRRNGHDWLATVRLDDLSSLVFILTQLNGEESTRAQSEAPADIPSDSPQLSIS